MPDTRLSVCPTNMVSVIFVSVQLSKIRFKPTVANHLDTIPPVCWWSEDPTV